jgi:hypothetical protein
MRSIYPEVSYTPSLPQNAQAAAVVALRARQSLATSPALLEVAEEVDYPMLLEVVEVAMEEEVYAKRRAVICEAQPQVQMLCCCLAAFPMRSEVSSGSMTFNQQAKGMLPHKSSYVNAFEWQWTKTQNKEAWFGFELTKSFGLPWEAMLRALASTIMMRSIAMVCYMMSLAVCQLPWMRIYFAF